MGAAAAPKAFAMATLAGLCCTRIFLPFRSSGVLIGVFASQFMSVLVANLFEADMMEYQFVFSQSALIKTIIYFAIIYVIVMLLNLFTTSKYK